MPPARADGDPASDILQIATLYTPLAQKISPPVLEQLQGAISSANAAGFKVRVALILDRTDLGAVPQLFGHPEAYVRLLGGELSFAWKGGLIAVQPAGVGVRNIEPLAPAQRIVSRIELAHPATSDDLARAATTAIRELAAAAGYRIVPRAARPDAASASSSSSFSTILIVLAAAVIGLATAVIAWSAGRRRRRGGVRP